MSAQVLLRYVKIAILFLVIHFLTVILVSFIALRLNIEIPPTNRVADGTMDALRQISVKSVFFLFMAAFFEEVGFRMIPLSPVLASPRLRKYWLIVAIVASGLFGYIHGTLIHAVVIGIGGLLLSVQFVASWKIEGDLAKATQATALTHFAWNASILYLLPLLI